jgi:Ulp1 family protease
MGLSDYINEGKAKEAKVEKETVFEDKRDALLKKLKKTEYTFYLDVLSLDDGERKVIKNIHKSDKGIFKFINRNVPFGGIKKKILDNKLDDANKMIDDFCKGCTKRASDIRSSYGSDITRIKNKIKKNIEEEEKQTLLVKNRKAQQKAKEKAIEKAKELQAKQLEQESETKLRVAQDKAQAENLLKQQEQKIKEDDELKASEENAKKEKEVEELAKEYKELMDRRKELIGSDDDQVEIERERIKHDIDQILMIISKYDLDEADLALRNRKFKK